MAQTAKQAGWRDDWRPPRPKRPKRSGERGASEASVLAPEQVAKELSVSERQVRRRMLEGWLDYIQLPKGRRITREQLDAFLRERMGR